jgi:hypothetical protein
MNTRRIWSGGLAAALALGVGACDMDSLTDVNENPNNPTSAPPPSLFVNAARSGVTNWHGVFGLRNLELMAQHMAEVQYPESDSYVRQGPGFTSGNFDAAYSGELKDFQAIIRDTKPLGQAGYWAPAQIMRAWEFGVITDLFGDVPYSAALMGDSVGMENATQPAYDAQQAIYNDLFLQLAEAAAALSTTPAVTLGGADVIFEHITGNRTAAWRRFANSLRARHAMRIVNVDAAKASAELAAAFSDPGGVFTEAEHGARLGFSGAGNINNNPWWTNFGTRDDHRVSDRLMFFMNGFSDNDSTPAWTDPRRAIYAQPATTTGRYTGLENALTHADAIAQLETTSRPGSIFYGGATAYGTFPGPGARTPLHIMTTAEVYFIRAEAAERGLGGLTPAQAAGFYQAGIRASMAQWGVTDAAAIDAYLARPDVAYKGGDDGLVQIGTQKWIALYQDGAQAWSEWRRTCVPESVRPGPNAILSTVPRRFQYSTTELATNADNVNAAIARQGADALTTRVWWDKSPGNAPTMVSDCGQRPSVS